MPEALPRDVAGKCCFLGPAEGRRGREHHSSSGLSCSSHSATVQAVTGKSHSNRCARQRICTYGDERLLDRLYVIYFAIDGVEPLSKHAHSSINFFCGFQEKLYSVQEHSNSWGSYSHGKEQRLVIIYSVGERERNMGRMEIMEGETAAGIA